MVTDTIHVMPAKKQMWLAALACLAFLILAGSLGPKLIQRGVVSPLTNAVDFRAFLCAGEALKGRADPYRVEPLRSCEFRDVEAMGLHTYADLVVPAPLPPYALIGFAALAALSYTSAVCVWFGLLLVSVVVVVAALRRSTQVSPIILTLVVTLSALNALMLGQAAPLICALLVLAGLAFASRFWTMASLLLGLAMFEPHLALPAAIGAFVYEKAMRLRLVIVACILIAVSLVGPGLPIAVEYVSVVVPLHALSEVNALQTQYSLATILAELGVPVTAALRFGEIDFLIMIIVGVIIGRRFLSKPETRALALLLPSALTLLGGVYVHLYAFYIAVVAALMLRQAGPRSVARLCDAAIILVLISMSLDNAFGTNFIPPYSADLFSKVRSVAQPDAFASAVARVWHTLRMSEDPRTVLAIIAIKLPAYFGLFALLIASIRAARGASVRFADQFAGESIFGKSGASSGATISPSGSIP